MSAKIERKVRREKGDARPLDSGSSLQIWQFQWLVTAIPTTFLALNVTGIGYDDREPSQGNRWNEHAPEKHPPSVVATQSIIESQDPGHKRADEQTREKCHIRDFSDNMSSPPGAVAQAEPIAKYRSASLVVLRKVGWPRMLVKCAGLFGD
jgi:hypothetical protein